MKKLADEDLALINEFVGVVLDRYKAGLCTLAEGTDDIVHLIATVDKVDGGNHRAYMLAIIASKDT